MENKTEEKERCWYAVACLILLQTRHPFTTFHFKTNNNKIKEKKETLQMRSMIQGSHVDQASNNAITECWNQNVCSKSFIY